MDDLWVFIYLIFFFKNLYHKIVFLKINKNFIFLFKSLKIVIFIFYQFIKLFN